MRCPQAFADGYDYAWIPILEGGTGRPGPQEAYVLFSGGLRSARLSENYTRAVFHARMKMESLLLSESPETGETNGEFEDGYLWTARVEHLEREEKEGQTSTVPFETYRYSVKVFWNEGKRQKQFSLKTLHLIDPKAMEG